MALTDRRPGVRPRQTLGRRLDIMARTSFPACSTILLMLLIEAPFGVPGQQAFLPAVAISCVWFWSLVQPRCLPPPVVFVIGLMMDLQGYLPVGVGVLTLLSCHGIAVAARRRLAQRGFAVIWLCFAPIAIGAALLMWLLVMLLTFTLLAPDPAVFQAVLSIALYPALAVPLGAAQRSITNLERA